MTNTDLTPTSTNNALKVAEEPSLIQSVLAWQLTSPVPEKLGQSIDALEGTLRQSLQPCSLDAYVVLLDRLFTATERPRDDAVVLWRPLLDHLPEAVLARAVAHVASTYKYKGPPKPAHVLEATSADMVWQDLQMASQRLSIVKNAWTRQQANRAPDVPVNPAALALLAETAKAMRMQQKHTAQVAEKRRVDTRKARHPDHYISEARRNVGTER